MCGSGDLLIKAHSAGRAQSRSKSIATRCVVRDKMKAHSAGRARSSSKSIATRCVVRDKMKAHSAGRARWSSKSIATRCVVRDGLKKRSGYGQDSSQVEGLTSLRAVADLRVRFRAVRLPFKVSRAASPPAKAEDFFVSGVGKTVLGITRRPEWEALDSLFLPFPP
jgi:hypothetical protein